MPLTFKYILIGLFCLSNDFNSICFAQNIKPSALQLAEDAYNKTVENALTDLDRRYWEANTECQQSENDVLKEIGNLREIGKQVAKETDELQRSQLCIVWADAMEKTTASVVQYLKAVELLWATIEAKSVIEPMKNVPEKAIYPHTEYVQCPQEIIQFKEGLYEEMKGILNERRVSDESWAWGRIEDFVLDLTALTGKRIDVHALKREMRFSFQWDEKRLQDSNELNNRILAIKREKNRAMKENGISEDRWYKYKLTELEQRQKALVNGYFDSQAIMTHLYNYYNSSVVDKDNQIFAANVSKHSALRVEYEATIKTVAERVLAAKKLEENTEREKGNQFDPKEKSQVIVEVSGEPQDGNKGYPLSSPRKGIMGSSELPNYEKLHPYLIVDLSGGTGVSKFPIRFSEKGPDLNDEHCKTTELWMRYIPSGTFLMGAPSEEIGHKKHDNEPEHPVTITTGFYAGIFEVTQKQWENVMGENPSRAKGDVRPVDNVSYDMIRGNAVGNGWPTSRAVDEGSFMGVLRLKTGLCLDLPTEAEWEYACRAGTTTSLNSGKNLTSEEECPNLAEVGRYNGNEKDGKGGFSSKHTRVGSYLPNAWGLYDMHGNIQEWCLDWQGRLSDVAVTNPMGPPNGDLRVSRGGGWSTGIARGCRSATRYCGYSPQHAAGMTGLRVALVVGASNR